MTTISDSAEVSERIQTASRLASLEAERPHLATKADINGLETKMERQTKQIILWFVGTAVAFIAVMIPVALALFEMLKQILERLPPAT